MLWMNLWTVFLLLPSSCSGWIPSSARSCSSCNSGSLSLPLYSSFEDHVSSIASGSSNNDRDGTMTIINAAAQVTQDQFKLLGIRTLGVDYGLARTGVAVSVGYNPEPIDIIEETNATVLAHRVVQLALSQQVQRVILGLPLHKNGTEAEQCNVTRIFGKELAALVLEQMGPRVPVLLWDERYSSKEAAARAHAKDPGRFLYGTLDADAACIILENYYEDNGEGAERIELDDDVRDKSLQIYRVMVEHRNRERQALMDDWKDRNLQKQEIMDRAKKLEEEMRAKGVLGQSNKKKKKQKKKRKKTKWISVDLSSKND